MFEELYFFVDLVVMCLVLRLPMLCNIVIIFSPGFNFDFLLVLAKKLAGKSVSDMTYLVSSGTLNLNSVNLNHLLSVGLTCYRLPIIVNCTPYSK